MKVAWHLGLGDAIACAAIIAKLATQNDVVEIPCWEHNLVSVKSFFVNYPNVKIQPIKMFDKEIGSEFFLEWAKDVNLKLGFYDHVNLVNQNPQLPTEDFVQWFYRQANFDMNEKDKWCPIEDASFGQSFPATFMREKKFIHDDNKRGFVIDINGLDCHRPNHISESKESILLHQVPLYEAKEIHCIDSSFLHLVECLPTKGKLFYHKYARPNSTDYKYLKKEWQILN